MLLGIGESKYCGESSDSGRDHFYYEDAKGCDAVNVCNIVLYIVCCLLTIFGLSLLVCFLVYEGMSECNGDPFSGDISQLSDISEDKQEDSFSVKVSYFE